MYPTQQPAMGASAPPMENVTQMPMAGYPPPYPTSNASTYPTHPPGGSPSYPAHATTGTHPAPYPQQGTGMLPYPSNPPQYGNQAAYPPQQNTTPSNYNPGYPPQHHQYPGPTHGQPHQQYPPAQHYPPLHHGQPQYGGYPQDPYNQYPNEHKKKKNKGKEQ